jgi:hypothetical protein
VREHDVGDLGQHSELGRRQQVNNMLADGTDMFRRGVDDPSGRLEAGARQMAGVKLRGVDDLDVRRVVHSLAPSGQVAREDGLTEHPARHQWCDHACCVTCGSG